MAINTPWGVSQYIEKKCPGISFIGTAGHGGFRVSENKYLKRIEQKQLPVGNYTAKYGSYLYFEEDYRHHMEAMFPNGETPMADQMEW